MANITETIGTFTIDPDEYQQNQEAIDMTLDTQINGVYPDYGITSTEYVSNGEFKFTGSGRWSFDNLLSNPFFDAILPGVSQIEFDYYDYDDGMRWIHHVNAIITRNTKEGVDEPYSVNITNTKDIPCTNQNLVLYDFEDGYNINKDRSDFINAIESYYLDNLDRFKAKNIPEAFSEFKDILGRFIWYFLQHTDGYVLELDMEDPEYLDEIWDEIKSDN